MLNPLPKSPFPSSWTSTLARRSDLGPEMRIEASFFLKLEKPSDSSEAQHTHQRFRLLLATGQRTVVGAAEGSLQSRGFIW